MIIIRELIDLLAILFILYEVYVIIYPSKIIEASNCYVNKIEPTKISKSYLKAFILTQDTYFYWSLFGLVLSNNWGLYLLLNIIGIINSILLDLEKSTNKYNTRVDAVFSMLILIMILLT